MCLYTWIHAMTKDEYKNITSCSDDAIERFLKIHSESDFVCKCGNHKRIRKMSSGKNKPLVDVIDVYCGRKECHPRYGILRPEHSKYMKLLVESGSNEKFSNSLMKPGFMKNKEVNTLEFIKKKLTNKGYSVNGLSDKEIHTLNKEYERDKQFTPKSLAKSIVKFINKHAMHDKFQFCTYDSLIRLSYDDLMKERYRMKSWHHAIYCLDKCTPSYYKRSLVQNLKFNLRGLTSVLTKSSYETNFIKYFEKNSVMWDYEPIRIELDVGSYTPDFVIDHNDEKYIIEVKGYLPDEDKISYLTRKINSGYDYANANGFNGFIFTFDSTPKSIEHLKTQIMKEKY